VFYENQYIIQEGKERKERKERKKGKKGKKGKEKWVAISYPLTTIKSNLNKANTFI
jgi:hypothetical protein